MVIQVTTISQREKALARARASINAQFAGIESQISEAFGKIKSQEELLAQRRIEAEQAESQAKAFRVPQRTVAQQFSLGQSAFGIERKVPIVRRQRRQALSQIALFKSQLSEAEKQLQTEKQRVEAEAARIAELKSQALRQAKQIDIVPQTTVSSFVVPEGFAGQSFAGGIRLIEIATGKEFLPSQTLPTGEVVFTSLEQPKDLQVAPLQSVLTKKETALEKISRKKEELVDFFKGLTGEPTGSLQFNRPTKTFESFNMAFSEGFVDRPETIKEARRRVESEFLESQLNLPGSPGFKVVGGFSTNQGEFFELEPSEELLQQAREKGKKEIKIFQDPKRLGASIGNLAQAIIQDRLPKTGKEFFIDVGLFLAGLATGGGSVVAKSVLGQLIKNPAIVKGISTVGTSALVGLGGFQVFQTVKSSIQAPTELEAGAILGKSIRETVLFGGGVAAGRKLAKAPFTLKVDFPESTRFISRIDKIEDGFVFGKTDIVTRAPKATAVFTKAELLASRITGKEPKPTKVIFDEGITFAQQPFKIKQIDSELSFGKSITGLRRKGAKSLTKFEESIDITKRIDLEKKFGNTQFEAFQSIGKTIEGIGKSKSPEISVGKDIIIDLPIRLKRASRTQRQFDLLTGTAKESPFSAKTLIRDLGEISGRNVKFARSIILSKRSLSSRGRKRIDRDVAGFIIDRSTPDTFGGNIILGGGTTTQKKALSGTLAARITSLVGTAKTKKLKQITKPVEIISDKTSRDNLLLTSSFAGRGVYERTQEVVLLKPLVSPQVLQPALSTIEKEKVIPTSITSSGQSTSPSPTQTLVPRQIIIPRITEVTGLVTSITTVTTPTTTSRTIPRITTPSGRIRLTGLRAPKKIPQLGGESFRRQQRGKQRTSFVPSLVGSARFNILGKKATITRRQAKNIIGLPIIRPVVRGRRVITTKRRKRKIFKRRKSR